MGGEGLDRLVMLLTLRPRGRSMGEHRVMLGRPTDKHSIREVLLFPALRGE